MKGEKAEREQRPLVKCKGSIHLYVVSMYVCNKIQRKRKSHQYGKQSNWTNHVCLYPRTNVFSLEKRFWIPACLVLLLFLPLPRSVELHTQVQFQCLPGPGSFNKQGVQIRLSLCSGFLRQQVDNKNGMLFMSSPLAIKWNWQGKKLLLSPRFA